MECIKYRKLISEYIDGEISILEEEALIKHLEICPECNLEMKNFSILSNSIEESYSDSNISIDLSSKIMSQIKTSNQTEIKNSKGNKILKLLKPVSIAASVAIVSSVIYFSIDNNKNNLVAEKQQIKNNENIEQLVMEHIDRASVAVNYDADVTLAAYK